MRDILERASARETTARVACGAVAKQLLSVFGIEIRSHVIQLGGIPDTPLDLTWSQLAAIADDAPLHCADTDAHKKMIELIDPKRTEGDTLGGIFEVVARGAVPGLGSHTSWDLKLDGRLAQAVMSIPAVKAVAIGAGARASDCQVLKCTTRFPTTPRRRNSFAKRIAPGVWRVGLRTAKRFECAVIRSLCRHCGRAALIDIDTKETNAAGFGRTDTTAVPAAGVIGESMVALVLAGAMREKFGGDSLGEMKRNFEGYREQLRGY